MVFTHLQVDVVRYQYTIYVTYLIVRAPEQILLLLITIMYENGKFI